MRLHSSPSAATEGAAPSSEGLDVKVTSIPEGGALIILLHGVGSNGQNMLSLANAWREALPDVAFSTPDAPFSFDHGTGYQWFSIAGVTERDRPQRIAAGRAAFDQVILTEVEKHGFADRLDRVVLVGFSQGSMMLIDAVITGRWPVAAGIAFAGRLASSPPFPRAHQTRMLLIHGAADAVVPPLELERASAALEAAGFTVVSRLLPGVGHTVSPKAAQEALEFVRFSLNDAALA